MKLAILKEDTSLIQSVMRNTDRFRQALDNFHKYVEEGEQTATEFKEMKETLNRGISEAWNRLIRDQFINGGLWEQLPRDVYDVIGDLNVQLHTIPGALKKARKAPEHPMTEMAIKILETLEQLAIDIKGMKGNIVKKKKAKRDEEAAAEEKTRTMLGNDDVQRVQSALEQITEDLKEEIYQNNLQWLRGVVKTWHDQYNPENEKTHPREYFQNDHFRGMIIQRVTTREGYHYNSILKLNDDYDEYLQKEAKQITKQMIDRFVYKNTQKLAEILTHKNNLKTVTLRGADTSRGTIEGTLGLAFKDDSSFIVHSKLVFSYSVKGTPFSRYPTTFHNVVFPDGTRMTGRASEARMKDEFVNA